MADLGTYDFEWVRGTTEPLVVSLKINNIPIEADDVRLSVYKNNSKDLAFRLSSLDNAGTGPGKVNVDTGVYTFQPTEAQTRSLTATKRGDVGKNGYELAVRNGLDERVYMLGTIAGIGGLNDDEVVS